MDDWTRIAMAVDIAERQGKGGQVTKDLRHLLEEVHTLRARLATKQEALVDLFNMIEEGLLVRDITGDNSADYHQNAIAFVMRLKNARAALAQEEA